MAAENRPPELEPGEAEELFLESRKVFFDLTGTELHGYLQHEERWRAICVLNRGWQCYLRVDYDYGDCTPTPVPQRPFLVAAIGFATAARFQELSTHEDPLSILLDPSLEPYLHQARHRPRIHKKCLLAYQRAADLFEQITKRSFGPCWPVYLKWRDHFDDSHGTASVLRAVESWALNQEDFETYPISTYLDYTRGAEMISWDDNGKELFSQMMAFLQGRKLRTVTQPDLETRSNIQRLCNGHGIEKSMEILRAWYWSS